MKRLVICAALVAAVAHAQFTPPLVRIDAPALGPNSVVTPFIDAGTINAQIVNAVAVDAGSGLIGGITLQSSSLYATAGNNLTLFPGSGLNVSTIEAFSSAKASPSAFYASSTSGGMQFAGPVRLTTELSDSTVTPTVPASLMVFNNNFTAGDALIGWDSKDAGTGIWLYEDGTLATKRGGNIRNLASAQPIDGGAAVPYFEYGNVTCSSSRCPVTFRNAFAVGPRCTCAGYTDAGCNLEGPASTTAVAFHSGVATQVLDWFCVGDR